MNKQQIMSALKLEPFSVIDARQKVKDLQTWLDSYDKGELSTLQFESFLYRNTNKASHTVDALITAIEYVIENPSVKKIVVLSHADDNRPHAKLLETYLEALAKAGVPFREYLTIATECSELRYATIEKVCTQYTGLKLQRCGEDLIVWTTKVPEFLLTLNGPKTEPTTPSAYPTVQPLKRMSCEEAFEERERKNKQLRELNQTQSN